MYYEIERTKDLKHNQMVICRCPDWNDEGYQVAQWCDSDKEFWYSGQQNDMFNKCVIAFCPLDEDGELQALKQ